MSSVAEPAVVRVPIKVYYGMGSSSLAPHIVSEWTKQEVELVKPGDDFAAKVNPAGAVPAIVTDDGNVLTQNVAILQYLAKRAGDEELLGGAKLGDQAAVSQWSAFLAADLHPCMWLLFFSKRYTTDESEEAVAKTKAAGLVETKKKMAILEAHMEGRDFFATNHKTIADAQAVTMFPWFDKVVPGGLAAYPNLTRFQAAMSLDEGVVKAIAAHV